MSSSKDGLVSLPSIAGWLQARQVSTLHSDSHTTDHTCLSAPGSVAASLSVDATGVVSPIDRSKDSSEARA